MPKTLPYPEPAEERRRREIRELRSEGRDLLLVLSLSVLMLILFGLQVPAFVREGKGAGAVGSSFELLFLLAIFHSSRKLIACRRGMREVLAESVMEE